ncbi:MAG: PEP-CTERM sorting domain-containing protein [Planctomycetota bacterium]|jgi:hypothetical protein
MNATKQSFAGRVVAIPAFLLATTSLAEAGIINTTGDIIQIPAPPSVMLDQFESASTIYAFDEVQGFTLTADVLVDASQSGTYSDPLQLTPATIPAGTFVNVYIVHFDPLGQTDTQVSGSVTFDQDILGIICMDATLDATDAQLGAPGTSYPTGTAHRELELGNDIFSIGPGMRTVTIDRYKTRTVMDQVRIITLVPEPSTIGLLGLAGLAVIRRRRR